MAWDAYLHLEGIKGEATRAGHEGDIALKAFTLGGSLPVISRPGEPLQVAGRASVSGFNFSKKTDGASPELFNAMCRNLKFPKAKVSFYRGGSDTSVPYIEYEFEDVVLADLTWSGKETGDGIPEEDGTLYFNTIRVIYTEPAADGTASGTREAEYNIGTVD
jgi:type VI secretion system secreted protein Hcp